MSDDSALHHLEALATGADIDELALNTEASRLGSDLDGLRLLVERYAQSSNRSLVRAVTFPLSRAPWELTEHNANLNDVIFTFLRGTASSDDAGTLTGCATALQGLSARRLLRVRTDEDQAALNRFLANCLDHADVNVRGVCLHLLGHLYADAMLERVLTAEMVSELKARLRGLNCEAGAEFRAEMSALAGFLDSEDVN